MEERSMSENDRRKFLKNMAGLGAGAALLTSCSQLVCDKETHQHESCGGSSEGGFSFVHITDQHVQRKRHGVEGYKECVKSIKREPVSLEFAVMGGDLAFDGNYNPKEKFVDEVKLYRDISRRLEIPFFHCMGNHDTLGLSPRRKVSIDDPDFGKKCIMRILDWPSSYYSFDHKGWHFVVLDCIREIDHPEHGPIYTPAIDEKQLKWLEADLGRVAGKPTVAFTHVAAFCNIGQIQSNPDMKAMTGMVISNNKELRRIFERHNVKALVQGHSHDIEEFMYNDVWYVTSTAASGAWWAGNWTGSKTGYTIFHCNGDRLSWEHKTYDWEARLEPDDDLERERIKEYRELQAKQKLLKKQDIAKGSSFKPLPTPELHVKL